MSKLMRKLKRLFGGKRSRDILPDYVSIGRGTYGLDRNAFQGLSPDAPISIGNFCSFGFGVVIFSKADHPLDLPSTYPLRTMLLHPGHGDQDAVSKGGVTIGHDVWVGARAMILSGVTIGNGAVIGAGAVVAKDVEPYAIVVGNPAKVVRKRFSAPQIAALEKTQWWNWPDDKIRAFESRFYGDIESFIKAAEAS
ncbi:CatB-related O-acetyltransferase [Magnetovibrio sp.]|uniref:CatB-related O-acetyltransferase n=1 Tax=Magnetovibrio sp. TaxID=2024836 RepID=UPI002F91FFCC